MRRAWCARRAGVLAAGLIVGIVLVAGCAGSGTPEGAPRQASGTPSPASPPQGGPSSPATTTSSPAPVTASRRPGTAACLVLTPAEVAELAGSPVAERLPAQVGGLPACRVTTDGAATVQLVAVPAFVWAEHLPELMEHVERSGLFAGDAETLAKFEAARRRIEQGGRLTNAAACELFADLVELQGMPPGSRRVVNFVPTREDPQAVNGQSCRHGTFVSVQLVSPGLSGSQAEARRTGAALRAAEDRAR